MSRHSRKTTDVQTQAPAPPAHAVTAEARAPVAEAAPRLGTGWKVAIALWLLCFLGLGAYELVDLVKYVWRLVFG